LFKAVLERIRAEGGVMAGVTGVDGKAEVETEVVVTVELVVPIVEVVVVETVDV